MSHVFLWIVGRVWDLLSTLNPLTRSAGDENVFYHSHSCKYRWHLADAEGEALEGPRQ